MAAPIPGVGISTPYGKRGSYWSCNPDSSGNGVHTGVDFACPAGTDILAPIPGQIRHRNYGSAFGSHQFAISPDPGQPFGDGEVFFAHTTDRPADGSWVEVGDYVAAVGAEGNVSGPHLHMEYHPTTKGSWSCAVHADPQPVLDFQASTDPTNPNGVKPGQVVLVIAEGALNGRDAPGGAVITSKPFGAEFTVAQVSDGWAQEATQSSLIKTSANSAELVATAAATSYLMGADISSHQGSGWVPAPDEKYVFVKATEGRSYTNPSHHQQVAMVRSRGLQVGHYHWLVAGNTSAQVDYFLAQAEIQPGDLIALDWEDGSNPPTSEKDSWIRQVLDRTNGDNRVGLYCNRDWWLNHDTSSYAGDFLWIANYTSAEDPGIQAEWLFWQYTSSPYDRNRGRFTDLAALQVWAGSDGGGSEPPQPGTGGLWYSTDYLFPKITPDPSNPHGLKAGDLVEVTAAGGLKARILPGGPQSVDADGEPLVRPEGYQFDITTELVDGWATGGSHWYSSDYLAKVTTSAPGWTGPTVILDDPTPDPDAYVSYLQACQRVAALDTDDGKHYDACYLVAQDYKNQGNTRFGLLKANGEFTGELMMVTNGGHGQTFHAYRSAAGNLWVWTLIGDKAYRILWRKSSNVTASSSDVIKADYKGRRPVGSHEPWVGFRSATDTRETFSLHNRYDFNDGNTAPTREVTIDKRTSYTQQTWAVTEDRIYRLMGSTNDDPPNGSRLHILDVFDWSGKLLLDRMDLTRMCIDTSSDEPEGLTFTGTPGSLLVGKREGSTDPVKRSYPLWTMTGLP